MTDTERLAFEKFCVDTMAFTDWSRFGDGYAKPFVQVSWIAWQARARDNRCAELLEAAKIFGALLQPLHDEHKDHHPIYGINSVTITAGDLRRLTKAIAAFEESSAALQKQLR